MTISDHCGLQNDQRDGSSDVVHSTVMDSEHVNVKQEEWEEDVLCSLLSRHSNGRDMFSGTCEVERVQEAEIAECKYNSNTCGQMISKRYGCDAWNKAFIKWNIHRDETPYVCDVCYRAFKLQNALSSHKRTHTGDGPYTCDMCNKPFKQLVYLNKHKRTHTVETPYTCTDIVGTSYSCDVCNKVFSRHSSLVAHKRLHAGVIPYICDICDMAFKQLCDLKTHKLTHTSETQYICDICNKVFFQLRNLIAHKHAHNSEQRYTCDICNKKFKHRGPLVIHEQCIHARVTPYVCKVCNKAFRLQSSLSTHERSHRGEAPRKPHVCDVCNKAFKLLSSLSTHKRTTHCAPQICEVCNKAFRCLNKHKYTHTIKTPYTCTDTVETSYTCDVCNKVFNRHSRLVAHKRLHAGVIPYTYDICNKAYRYPTLLNNHKRTHTSEAPYICEVCNKAFFYMYHLNSHRRTHTGERPYVCDACNKAFSQLRCLKQHTCRHTHIHNAASEQPQGSERPPQNTTVPFISFKIVPDEMTISDDCGLQDDQRDGSSNVMCSTVMDSEDFNTEQSISEQPQGSEHQLQNTAVPFIWYKNPTDEMTISDEYGLHDDQRDGSLDVMRSTVMDSEHVNVKEEEWEEDVLCSLLSRHSNMLRGSCEVERVQEVEVTEYSANYYTVMDSEKVNVKKEDDLSCSHLSGHSHDMNHVRRSM